MTCPVPANRRGHPLQAERELTERQCELLAFIHAFTVARGYAPSTRDFLAAFGWKSTNAPWEHLDALRTKRTVTWAPGLARTLRLTESGQEHAEAWLREHLAAWAAQVTP